MFSIKRSIIFNLLLPVILPAVAVHAQNTKDKNLLDSNIISRDFIFIPETVQPLSGTIRQLTSEYRVAASIDTINAYLPYFGRAYTPPIGEINGGINFSSTRFEYHTKPTKKGSWELSIIPKDVSDVRQLYFIISRGGYASLRVTSNSRQDITFNGYIISGKKKK